MRLKARVIVAICLLVVPAGASAQQTITPPGKAGADQYFETIPSGAGNARPPQGSTPGGAGTSATAAGIAALSRRGPDGRAAAAFAAASAPAAVNLHGGAKAAGSDTPSATAVRAIDGSDAAGLGIALPILLVTVAVGFIALAFIRRRAADDPI